MSAKPRLRINVRDNWYGYLGRNRVASFGNTSHYTAQQHAEMWLRARQGYAVLTNTLAHLAIDSVESGKPYDREAMRAIVEAGRTLRDTFRRYEQ